MYFGDQASVRCVFNEDLFSFCRLSFCPLDRVLCLIETFQFDGIPFMNCEPYCLNIGVLFRKLSPVPLLSRLVSTFSSIKFSIADFMLRYFIHWDSSCSGW